MTLDPFHLAFPVPSLDAARAFFSGLLGCEEGRSAPRWVDFDFRGHQISAHLVEENMGNSQGNSVDGDRVPCRHFGLILSWEEWEQLAETLTLKGARFVIEPKVRFRGRPGEQATMFVQGPGSNVLEFKAFRDKSMIFER